MYKVFSLYILIMKFVQIAHVSYFVQFMHLYTGPGVTKLFSCSTQVSMKFQLLKHTKMLKNIDFSCFQTVRC